MKTLKNGHKSRIVWMMLCVAFAAQLQAQEGILDFDRFKREIEPVILEQNFTSPGPASSCFSCHGDPANQGYDEYPLVLGQSRDNFIETSRQINLDDPDISFLLLKPLALAAGGLVHGNNANDGGEQFINSQDSTYQLLINWILDATRSNVGARITKTEPYPNPFRFKTDIVYFLSTAANDVKVKVFASDGRELRTFVGGKLVGANFVTWDGRDNNNEPLPTGVYFYQVQAEFRDGEVAKNGRIVFTP